MRSWIEEFRTFILRGNVIDLAVAVVIGGAFGAVVTSLVENIITPIIGAFGGQPDFSELTFTINNSVFHYGAFLNSLVSFLIIAAVIFFFVVKPMNVMLGRLVPKVEEVEPTICPHCLSNIPDEATRCPSCTTWLKGPNAVLA